MADTKVLRGGEGDGEDDKKRRRNSMFGTLLNPFRKVNKALEDANRKKKEAASRK